MTTTTTEAIAGLQTIAAMSDDPAKIEVADMLLRFDRNTNDTALEAQLANHPEAAWAADYISDRTRPRTIQEQYDAALQKLYHENEHGFPLDVERARKEVNRLDALLHKRRRK